MRRSYFLLFFLFISLFEVFSQNSAVVKGRVIDAATKLPIEFADVVLTDTANHTIASSFVNKGDFMMGKIKQGEYLLSVLLVGYQPYHSKFIHFSNGNTVNLGTISLTMLETGLKEVTVTADKKKVIYKLDRQQISASATVAASGGTAVDILNATPSIRVDADGGVSFRGSTGFLVYVDGKPSTVEGTQALQQIPASTIEDIEIITTPSARYKTEGDVGIINIKTKRHKKEGISGSVNLTGSTIGTHISDILLNYRSGNTRWYIGGTGSDIAGKSDFRQKKTTIIDDYTTTSDANGKRHSNSRTYIGRLGWEFDDGHIHHLLVELQSGTTENARGGDMNYYEHRLFQDEVINDNNYTSHDRYSLKKNLAQIMTDYTLRLNDRGDKFSIAGRLRHDWNTLEYTESNMFDTLGVRYEGTRGYESEYHWDFDGTMSYEMNYSKQGKLELGYQFTSYSEVGDYKIKYWDRSLSDFVWQDDLYAPFYYRRQIHSLYGMVNDKVGSFLFDAGVRGDYTLDRLAIAVAGANRNIKRMELFPSAHVSYDAKRNNTISLGYSYRTNRPGIWQLEPYITYEDYYTKQIGNPDIKPEYIHSFELGYRKLFAGENSLAVTGFYRARRGVRDRIRVAYQPGVTLDSLINAGNDYSTGLEWNLRTKPLSWWNITFNGSVFHYQFTSHYEGCTDASNTSYALTLINNFNLGRASKLEFNSNFVGPTVLTQGRENAYCYFDLAFRQQFLKNNLTASVVAHDIFHTAQYDNRRISSSLESFTHVRPKYPNIVFSVSYSFNAAGHKGQSNTVSSGALFEGKDF